MARIAKAVADRVRMRVHEPDLYALGTLSPESGLALDVGANNGQSAISILAIRPSFNVVSLEPNPACKPQLSVLSRLFGPRLQVLNVGAGNERGSYPFYIPFRSGRELLEEGTFDVATLGTAASIQRIGIPEHDYEIRERFYPVVIIDDLNLHPIFVKIDVQGLEFDVLRGMRFTIESSMPLIMIERGSNEGACADFLDGFGYVRRYWSGVELVESPTKSVNVFFVPQNRASR
jgi:FkbM family methyltransferase